MDYCFELLTINNFWKFVNKQNFNAKFGTTVNLLLVYKDKYWGVFQKSLTGFEGELGIILNFMEKHNFGMKTSTQINEKMKLFLNVAANLFPLVSNPENGYLINPKELKIFLISHKDKLDLPYFEASIVANEHLMLEWRHNIQILDKVLRDELIYCNLIYSNLTPGFLTVKQRFLDSKTSGLLLDKIKLQVDDVNYQEFNILLGLKRMLKRLQSSPYYHRDLDYLKEHHHKLDRKLLMKDTARIILSNTSGITEGKEINNFELLLK